MCIWMSYMNAIQDIVLLILLHSKFYDTRQLMENEPLTRGVKKFNERGLVDDDYLNITDR